MMLAELIREGASRCGGGERVNALAFYLVNYFGQRQSLSRVAKS